jgi:uncharacterized protein (TIGR03083 family)
MAEHAKESITAMRRSHDEMVEWVVHLAPDALETQSGASEWTVADVLSHLGSAAEIGRSTLLAGQADPDGAQPVWDRWNAMSPAEKAGNFLAAEGRLVEAYEALDDDELANKKVDVGFLPAPVDVSFLAGMRLNEVALHRWDVAVPFDSRATVADYLVPIVLVRLPLFAGFFAQSIGKTGRVALDTTDPSRHYLLDLREDGTTLTETDASDATDAGTQITLPAEALLRLTAGRLAPDHTPAGVETAGDLTLDDLRRVFPGY